ncbi:MAG: tellurite resistance TerB family protein [Marivibrio sp.]|uniref:tellurite resistance TerB family protein n=1 Tax=Marivibrio sp. TaxID=2039719 RepID=UPI0032EE6F30
MLSKYDALIYCMVLTSAADEQVSDTELEWIRSLIASLPVFRDYDASTMNQTAADCLAMLDDEDGIDLIMTQVKQALPERLRETAYALCVEVAAADLHASEEELNLLQIIRQKLELDRLICAGIERGARARFAIA